MSARFSASLPDLEFGMPKVRNADTGNPPLTIFDVAERVQIKSVVAQQMISVLV